MAVDAINVYCASLLDKVSFTAGHLFHDVYFNADAEVTHLL